MLRASSSLGSTKTLATRAYQSSGLKHDLKHIPENEPENWRGVRARLVRCPPLFTPDIERDHQGVDSTHYTERTGAASNHFGAQVAVLTGSPTPVRIGRPQHFARGLGGNFLRRDGAEPRHHTRPLRQTAFFR
jgi:hypothetical protein